MKELILNKFNSMPQQVEENRRNIKTIYEELQKYNLNYKGLYSSDITYVKNDVVVYGNSTYVHISDSATQGILPVATNTWALYIVGENVVITSSVKSVTQVEPDVQPYVTIEQTVETGEIGKEYNLEFSFGIPKGEQGEKGVDGINGENGTDGTNGVSAVIEGATADLTIIGAGETESVSVENLGTDFNRSFAFHFNLKNGENGTNGTDGATPLLTNINLTVDTLDAGTSAYGTAYFEQTTENVYELNMTLGIPRGNAGINSGEILNEFSVNDATKTYSVTFLNAFYAQVTSQFSTINTDITGLKEFQTNAENNALWGNNSFEECMVDETNKTYEYNSGFEVGALYELKIMSKVGMGYFDINYSAIFSPCKEFGASDSKAQYVAFIWGSKTDSVQYLYRILLGDDGKIQLQKGELSTASGANHDPSFNSVTATTVSVRKLTGRTV